MKGIIIGDEMNTSKRLLACPKSEMSHFNDNLIHEPLIDKDGTSQQPVESVLALKDHTQLPDKGHSINQLLKVSM